MQKIVVGITGVAGLGAVLVVGGYVGWRVFFHEIDLVEIDPVAPVTFEQIVGGEDGEGDEIRANGEHNGESTDENESGNGNEVGENIVEGDTDGSIDTDVPVLPDRMNLAVPFSSQAPSGDWNLPYQEACEETSLIMVASYYAGSEMAKLDAREVESKIAELVRFQEDLFGYYMDTTAEETVQVLDLFFGIGGRVVENPTIEQIKAEIASGRPVIVPASGRQLPNPYFSGEGPLYHMFVIKGYAEGTFITNDPGTRNGADFVYRQADIMNAVGDWNNGDPANGASVVIFTNL